MSDLTPAEASAIAGEAWLYAYAPVALYQTMYAQAIDPASPSFVGGFNRFRHYDRLATPDDTDIVTPNNDTPYSWAWLDLRAEPMVLSLPAVPERYYVGTVGEGVIVYEGKTRRRAKEQRAVKAIATPAGGN